MIYRSPYPDVPESSLSLPEFLLEGIDAYRNQMAMVDVSANRGYTYGQFAQGVRAVAAGLARRGLEKGDRVSLLSANCPEYLIATNGIMLAGGIVTTVNPLYTESELEHHFQDAAPRFVIAGASLLEKARRSAEKAGASGFFTFGEARGAAPFDELLAERGAPPRIAFDPREDVAAMLYSSGTTGLPKGVMLTHRNLVSAIRQCNSVIGEPVRASLCVLPMFHIFGFHAIGHSDLWNRTTLYTMARFEFEPFLAALERHRIERVCLVPPIILALVKSPLVDKYDLSNLKSIFSGAAPLDAELAAACEKRIGCAVRQGYGLTETSPPICGHPVKADVIKHGSVGQLTGSTEARLVSLETGTDVKPGEPGELWVRGPQIMKGYYNQPEATRDMLLPDGWLRTGDIARMDEDECLYIVDRAKELIKYKGMQVAPAELEAVLLTHPLVADAAVIGVPDEEAGEIPKAFVVLKGDLTAAELQEYVASQVAPFKKIRKLEFVEAIPKSPSGKILRRVLKDRERAAATA